jgi:hypothetical protein
MHYRKQQEGMIFLSWIFVLALVALLSLIIIRLFPIYTEYFSVKTSLEALAKQPDQYPMSKAEIRNALLRRLGINGIVKDNIEINKAHNALNIAVDYEVRTPLLGNIDLIAHFNRTIEVSSRWPKI